MKFFWVLLLLISMVASCTDDNEESKNNLIEGAWKLIKAEYYGLNQEDQFEMITIDFTSQNSIYVFNSNNILQVTGANNAGFENGEYHYILEEDYLSGAPSKGESKILLVKINDSKWTFGLEDGIMKLGQSYVDGSDLYFERK